MLKKLLTLLTFSPVLFCFLLQTAQARESDGTQYLFIIDDSGSMGREYTTASGEKNIPADPNRLAIFAARSMLMMLSPEDELAIIRLNGGVDQEQDKRKPAIPQDPMIRFIKLESKKEIQSQFKMPWLQNPLGAYAGKDTPCNSALKRAQQVLNRGYSDKKKQVVFFLTDGSCEVKDTPQKLAPAQDWLSKVNSYQDNNLKFFLLTFEGRDFSKELKDYTVNADGLEIGRWVEVSASNPIQIIKPFSDALAFANGVAPIVLEPGKQSIPAHPAAASVRLLSVSKDLDNEIISFNLKEGSQSGSNLKSVTNPKKIKHQWNASKNKFTYFDLQKKAESGDKFKASAIRYTPEKWVVWAEAIHATDDWRLIAIPEYHLSMKTEILQGKCETAGAGAGMAGQRPRKGEDACIFVSIYNHTGKNVTKELSETFPELKVEMKSELKLKEGSSGKSQRVPFKITKNKKHFAYNQKFSELGDYRLTPSVQLLSDGLQVFGETYTFSTFEVNITPTPKELDFGSVGLKAQKESTVTLSGEFKKTNVVYQLQSSSKLNCIDITIDGVKSNGSFSVAPKQALNIEFTTKELCGDKSINEEVTGDLILIFPNDDYFQGRQKTIQWKTQLSTSIGTPKDILLTIPAGEERSIDLSKSVKNIWGQTNGELEISILPQLVGTWPEQLQIGRLNPGEDGGILRTEDHQIVSMSKMLFNPQGTETLPQNNYLITSHLCCQGGEYKAQLLYRPNGSKSAQVIQNLTVIIEPKTWFECNWPWIKLTILFFGFVGLLVFIYNIWTKSFFINTSRLNEKILPLHYTGNSSRPTLNTKKRTKRPKHFFNDAGVLPFKDVINGKVHQGFRKWFNGRFMNWVKSNPLMLGFPTTDPYHESAKITLKKGKTFGVELISGRGNSRYLKSIGSLDNKNVSKDVGFFVIATSSQPTFVHRQKSTKIKSFCPVRYHDEYIEQEENEDLNKNKKAQMEMMVLKNVEIYTANYEPEEEEDAGWKIT